MPRTAILVVAALAVFSVSLSDLADARRMGGGRSLGAQRESITPTRPAPSPTAPAGNAVSPAQPAAPAAAATKAPAAAPAAAPSGASRWLGPIAGIAAGLGLAALMSHFGLSEGFGSLLLIAALVIGAIFVLRMFLARRQTAAATPAGAMQYANANDNGRTSYDAPAAPSWRGAAKTEPLLAAEPASPAFGVVRKPLPAGFDAPGFAKEAKWQYIQIQRSYDSGDRAALSSVMTPEMNAEVGRELDERVGHQPTEIVTLDADVLEVTQEADKYWASVRFTGLLREDGEPVPKAVDEIWNLTKPVNGSSGWLLAGIAQIA